MTPVCQPGYFPAVTTRTYPPFVALERLYAAREADWRNGPIVYHVMVDRFAPSADLDAKRHLYEAPRTLHAWSETPKQGTHNVQQGLWTHELAFWGGDLASTRSHLDHVQELGADVLYLNPICEGLTNHKYDADDYAVVAAEFGTRADIKDLADDLHARGMRLMLDGVFNHIGRRSPMFQDALANPASPYREWFTFSDDQPHGYRAWWNVANLPELRHESAAVRDALWGGDDSIVRSYLRDGVDGWRLDVAFELGMEHLSELTEAAHATKPGSFVIGEVWNAPEHWSPAIDAIMNFHARELVLELVAGRLSGPRCGRLLGEMVEDAGLEPVLKAWLMLDNHDTPRLATMVPDTALRALAQTLQFTLPGSPVLWYGTELGMDGGDDPETRAPMRWDLVNEENDELARVRELLDLRRRSRALKIGGFKVLEGEQLLAFSRTTDRAAEARYVVANPTAATVTEPLSLRDGMLMQGTRLVDELAGGEWEVRSGLVTIDVPARSVRVLRPLTAEKDGYTPYKRMP